MSDGQQNPNMEGLLLEATLGQLAQTEKKLAELEAEHAAWQSLDGINWYERTKAAEARLARLEQENEGLHLDKAILKGTLTELEAAARDYIKTKGKRNEHFFFENLCDVLNKQENGDQADAEKE